MKNFIIFFFFLIVLSSCDSFKNNCIDDNCYLVYKVDQSFFSDYNSIFLINKRGDFFWVLSKKLEKDTLFLNFNRFTKLVKDDFVKLYLLKMDTLKTIKSNVRGGKGPVGYSGIDDEKDIWRDDTIKADVYYSPQLIGLYMLKEKKK